MTGSVGQDSKEPSASLRRSVIDGAAFSVMDSISTNFLSPFALALSASNTFISVLATLPGLIAAFAQMMVTTLLRIYSSRKFWIVTGALLQALTWIPIALIPFIASTYGLPALFVLITLNAVFAAIVAPLWSSLMGDLVPEDERGSYFGMRTSIAGAVAFVSTFAAGLTLYLLSGRIGTLITFAVLFFIAFFARMISVYFLWQMHEPKLSVCRHSEFSLIDFIGRLRTSNYGLFVLYLCAFGFAVNVASPFFAVYMLRDLHLSYLQFTLITATTTVSGFVTVILWGKFCDRIGNKRILILTGLIIPLIPILWAFITDVKYLMLVEVLGGSVWAGFNLAASNYVYDSTSPEKRPRCIVYLNVLRGASIFIGAILGAFLSTRIPMLWYASTLPVIFIISGIMRIAVSLVFYHRLKEARLVEVTVRNSGNVDKIIVSPRQSMSYGHPMQICQTHTHEEHDPDHDDATRHEPPAGPAGKRDNHLHVKDVKEQRRLLSLLFRLRKSGVRLHEGKDRKQKREESVQTDRERK
jgi:MFS family permease